MNKRLIVQKTAEHVRRKFSGEGTGHDWWHIERVWKLAKRIGREEKANLFIVELAALLHDIADHKFHGGDKTIGPKTARDWLEKLGVEEGTIEVVCHIVANISFKGSAPNALQSLEGKVVQDADRLDALGAIGIARAFAYGGFVGQPLYDPKRREASTIGHFYEKLLLIKDRMHTQTAKQMARQRHKVIEEFLKQFYREWEGRS